MSRQTPSMSGLRQKSWNSLSDMAASETENQSKRECVVDMNNPVARNEQANKQAEIKLLFFDISHLPKSSQFLLLSAAVFFFYIIYGYMQELIFRLKEFRPFGWYLTLVQFACYTVFGVLEQKVSGTTERKLPLQLCGLLALLTVATMGLSNTSVGYLNYPTQVIFKCCKLIPVMLGGVLIQGRLFSIDTNCISRLIQNFFTGKKYGMLDVSAVLCMCFGLICFTLADSTVSPSFNTYGVMLISLALCADGVIGNVQEKAYKQYNCSNSEMVLYSYSIGFVFIIFGLIVSGSLLPAFTFCLEHPVETYGYAVIFSVTGYIGVNIVLTVVKTFGALVAVTVTTCRKAVSIVLSFIFFAKPFTSMYVWSGLIVVLGIYLNVYSKNKASWDSKFQALLGKIKNLRQQKKYPSLLTTV
ncbi:hypothetical protein FSP39_004331 [Pinctada imbricata]|uniref:Adenosine 3'-phospho 5'-phosphosulfate transporter 2 n=1 Tax=Pinctada imbricata TaxID=66713 RepID=A0AA89BPT7_PINIB|nr:hypothetical protein FSP39_004331 [Pinctada imbricata]